MLFVIIFYFTMVSIVLLYIGFINNESLGLADTLFNHKGYIFLYGLMVVLSIYYLDFNDLFIKNEILSKYGLTGNISKYNFYTLITSNFIHSDAFHLFINLLFLTFLGFLELQFGFIIFLLMFFIPSIISSLILVLFIPDNTVFLGSSIGLCSLYSIIVAESLIIDKLPVRIGLSTKIYDFLLGIVSMFVVLFLMSFGSKSGGSNIYTFAAHFLGAVTGYTFYCSLKYLTPDFFDYLIEKGTL